MFSFGLISRLSFFSWVSFRTSFLGFTLDLLLGFACGVLSCVRFRTSFSRFLRTSRSSDPISFAFEPLFHPFLGLLQARRTPFLFFQTTSYLFSHLFLGLLSRWTSSLCFGTYFSLGSHPFLRTAFPPN
ncbi:hypothetical protein BDV98DRAFT_568340 [Pterulicium gracile]|uniref:Uncharacterized protein n=1 Tax=Pterulicium gracile TaxID=1884261 RepID=A0A5C3QRP7_9AGAR|nr:hypothetical protein BDV98DRAFT_568340 [Pterula gracilis]